MMRARSTLFGFASAGVASLACALPGESDATSGTVVIDSAKWEDDGVTAHFTYAGDHDVFNVETVEATVDSPARQQIEIDGDLRVVHLSLARSKGALFGIQACSKRLLRTSDCTAWTERE